MALTTSIDLTIGILRSVGLELSSGGSSAERRGISFTKAYADGSSDGQADQVWSDSRSLAAGTETHDLQSLTQLDSAGATLRSSISFANAKVFYVRNTTAVGTAGYLRIGGAAANPWDGTGTPFETATGQIDIDPGGVQLWISHDGGAISAGALNLEVESVTNTMTYDICVVGDAS